MANGEVTIRRRAPDGALELRVNGVFVMDDQQTDSERLIAQHVVGAGAREVLVGGLGLGFTVRELLALDVSRVVVAELHEQIEQAMRSGQIPGSDLLNDRRLQLITKDIRQVVSCQPRASFDAIVLDVDNGPDFLVYESNSGVYEADFFTNCAAVVRDTGQLSVWSMADSDAVRCALAKAFESVAGVEVPVQLSGRSESYWILTGHRPIRR